MTTTTNTAMKKNDVIELITAIRDSNKALVESFDLQIANCQSADEIKALKDKRAKYNTKKDYVERMIQTETIADAVAAQAVSMKFTADQIRDLCEDSYSVAKFAALMIVLAQKRKIQNSDEHALCEFITVIATGTNDVTFNQMKSKMTTTKNVPYADTRQAQMCAKLLARLNAVTYKKDGSTAVIHFEHDSLLGKRIMKAYA